MQTIRWAGLSADAKADALRKEFDAAQTNEKQNLQERTYRFDRIEKRLDQLEAALRQIDARLGQLEWKTRSI
jgi:hypothetical protein